MIRRQTAVHTGWHPFGPGYVLTMTMNRTSSPPAPGPGGFRPVRVADTASAGSALGSLAPRFLTAGAYLAVWLVPGRVPAALAPALFVGMVLEFLLLHSYAFLNLATGVERGASFGKRLRSSLAVLGFGSFYLLMAGAIGWATHSTTPVWTIVWLLGGRIFEVAVVGDSASAGETRTASWMRHLLLYIFFAILTSVVPLPAFGLTPEIVAGFHLPGSGTWVEKPQSVLAFGFLYFGLGAYFDLRSRLRR